MEEVDQTIGENTLSDFPYKPLPVSGYVSQDDWAVDNVNDMKRNEELILRRLDFLAKQERTDKRWLAIGRTKIEEAFMAINRSIFKPQRIELSSDRELPDQRG